MTASVLVLPKKIVWPSAFGGRGRARPDGAAGPGAIVDDHVLPQRRLQALGEIAREHVGLPAGRRRNDHPDDFIRIGLRRERRAG